MLPDLSGDVSRDQELFSIALSSEEDMINIKNNNTYNKFIRYIRYQYTLLTIYLFESFLYIYTLLDPETALASRRVLPQYNINRIRCSTENLRPIALAVWYSGVAMQHLSRDRHSGGHFTVDLPILLMDLNRLYLGWL